MIAALYPVALDCGMTAAEFYSSSLAEVNDRIESENRRQKKEIRMLFIMAEVMANRVGCLFSSENRQLMPWDYDPEGFALEKVRYEAKKQQDELETYKDRRRRAMETHNQMRHRGGDINGGTGKTDRRN